MSIINDSLINPAKVGMPNHLDYNAMKKQGIAAKSFTSYWRSDYTGLFNAGSVANINLPCIQNQVLDASTLSLAFTVSTAGAAATLDGGAHALIQRLTTYWNSLMIDQLINYNLLQNMLLDCTMNNVERTNYGSIMWGGSDSPDTQSGVNRQGTSVPTSGASFCFPLLNILATSDKYIPLFAMAGSYLRFEIIFENYLTAFRQAVAGGLTGYTITNLELRGVVIELSDLALSMVKASTGGMYSLQTIRHDYFTDVVTSAGQYSTNINVKVSSARNIRFVQRYTDAITDPYSNSLLSYVVGGTHASGESGLQNFQFKYGNDFFPRRLMNVGGGSGWSTNDFSMPFWELMRSFYVLNSLQPNISFSATCYETTALDDIGVNAGPTAYLTTSTYANCFIGGISLEAFGGDRNGTVVQGLDTRAGLVQYWGTYGKLGAGTTANPGTGAMTLSFFVEYDSQIDIANGQVSMFF